MALRTLKQAAAKVASTCKVCTSNWAIGDNIYLVIDPMQDKVTNILCNKCGDSAKNDIESKAEKPTEGFASLPSKTVAPTELELLTNILSELKKISGVLLA